jgi:hypothetical protein
MFLRKNSIVTSLVTSQKNLALIGDNYPNYKYFAKKIFLAKNSNFTQKWPTKDLKIINYLCFSLF